MLLVFPAGKSACLLISGEGEIDGEVNLTGSVFPDGDGETRADGSGVLVFKTETVGEVCVTAEGIAVAVAAGVSAGVPVALGAGEADGIGTKFLFRVAATSFVSSIDLS